MTRIEQPLGSIMDDQRADYAWPTKDLAAVLNIHPNKVGAWWYANRAKLVALAEAMPGETSIELLRITAEANQRRRKSAPSTASASRRPVRPSI